MPFLPPNQQRQSAEGTNCLSCFKKITVLVLWIFSLLIDIGIGSHRSTDMQ